MTLQIRHCNRTYLGNRCIVYNHSPHKRYLLPLSDLRNKCCRLPIYANIIFDTGLSDGKPGSVTATLSRGWDIDFSVETFNCWSKSLMIPTSSSLTGRPTFVFSQRHESLHGDDISGRFSTNRNEPPLVKPRAGLGDALDVVARRSMGSRYSGLPRTLATSTTVPL